MGATGTRRVPATPGVSWEEEKEEKGDGNEEEERKGREEGCWWRGKGRGLKWGGKGWEGGRGLKWGGEGRGGGGKGWGGGGRGWWWKELKNSLFLTFLTGSWSDCQAGYWCCSGKQDKEMKGGCKIIVVLWVRWNLSSEELYVHMCFLYTC